MAPIRTAVLVLGLLATPLPGHAVADDDSATFTIDWAGEPFEELADPLARFRYFPVDDPDGDGYANLTAREPGWDAQTGAAAANTDGEVSVAMDALSVSVQDMHEQLEAVLSLTASGRALAPQASELLDAGRFADLRALLEGSPKSILQVPDLVGMATAVEFYCGGWVSARRVEGIVGVPSLLDCNADGKADDAAAMLTLTPLGLCSGATDDLDDFGLVLVTTGLKTQSQKGIVVGGWDGHLIGVRGSIQAWHFAASGTIENVCSDELSVDVSFAGDNFGRDDRVLYWRHEGGDTTDVRVWLELSKAVKTMDMAVDLLHDGDWDEWNLRARLDQLDGVRNLGVEVRPDDLRALRFDVIGIPQDFEVGYVSELALESGSRYLVSARTDEAMPDMELSGSVLSRDQVNFVFQTDFTFQFVGFPRSWTASIDPPNPENKVFSFGLTKGNAEGHFRTISFEGGSLIDTAFSGTISLVERWQLVSGKKDIFNGDDDSLLQNGARFAHHTGTSTITAQDIWFIKAESSLKVICWCPPVNEYRGNLGGAGCTFGCAEQMFEGEHEQQDRTRLNSYFWAIAANQLGLGSCVLKYDTGRCA